MRLWKLFEPIGEKEPKIYERIDKRYNKLNKSLYFRTKKYKEFKFLGDLFMDQDSKKRVPESQYLKEFLTLNSIYYWIFDDGQKVKNGGVTLCTDNLNLLDVKRLI